MDRRDVRLLLAANAFAVLCGYFGVVATAALAFRFSHAVPWMALQLGAGYLAPLVAQPWAGRWAARARDRRRVMVAGDLWRCAAAVALAGVHRGWELPVLNAAGALGGTLFGTAREALFVQIARSEGIAGLNAMRLTTSGVARVVGPVLAGFATAALGVRAALLVNGLGFAVSAIATAAVRARPRTAASLRTGAGARSGYRALLRDPLLGPAVVVEAAFMLGVWAVNTAWFAWIQGVPWGGTSVLGTAIAVYEGGSLVAGLLLPRLVPGGLAAALAAAAIPAAAWCVYPLLHSAEAIYALGAIEGAATWSLMSLVGTWVQQRVTDDRLAQALAAEGQVDAGARLAGVGLGAALGGWLGVPAAFPVFAAITGAGLVAVAVRVAGRTARTARVRGGARR